MTTASSTQETHPTVAWSPADVAGLQTAFGLTIGERSPLRHAARNATGRTPEQSLREAGWLTDPWREAMAILAGPDHQVRSIIPAEQRSGVTFWYGRRDSDASPMAGCQNSGNGVKVTFPWTAEDVASLSMAVLVRTLPPVPARAVPDCFLTHASLSALAAAIDLMRWRRMESMVRRQPLREFTFDLVDLKRQVDVGVQVGDGRWLVSLLQLLAPSARRAKTELLKPGLDELVAAGLINEADGSFTPGGYIHGLASDWREVLPAMGHELVTIEGGSSAQPAVRYESRISIRGSGPLWVFELGDIAKEDSAITLRCLKPAGYLTELAEFIRVARRTATAEPPSRTQAPDVTAEQPVVSPTGVCSQCGYALRPRARFCTKCGAANETG